MTLSIHDFIEAALPWMTMAVAIAIVATYSDLGQSHKEEKKIEKQDTRAAEVPQGHAAGARRRSVGHAADDNLTRKRKIQRFTDPRP